MNSLDESDQVGLMKGIQWPNELRQGMPTLPEMLKNIADNLYFIPAVEDVEQGRNDLGKASVSQ